MAWRSRTGQARPTTSRRSATSSTIERKRAARASRSFLLLLVSLRKEPGRSVDDHSGSGVAVVFGDGAVRPGGRFHRVVPPGARRGRGADAGAWHAGRPRSAAINERVNECPRARLPAREAQQLQVRVVQLCRRPDAMSAMSELSAAPSRRSSRNGRRRYCPPALGRSRARPASSAGPSPRHRRGAVQRRAGQGTETRRALRPAVHAGAGGAMAGAPSNKSRWTAGNRGGSVDCHGDGCPRVVRQVERHGRHRPRDRDRRRRRAGLSTRKSAANSSRG